MKKSAEKVDYQKKNWMDYPEPHHPEKTKESEWLWEW